MNSLIIILRLPFQNLFNFGIWDGISDTHSHQDKQVIRSWDPRNLRNHFSDLSHPEPSPIARARKQIPCSKLWGNVNKIRKQTVAREFLRASTRGFWYSVKTEETRYRFFLFSSTFLHPKHAYKLLLILITTFDEEISSFTRLWFYQKLFYAGYGRKLVTRVYIVSYFFSRAPLSVWQFGAWWWAVRDLYVKSSKKFLYDAPISQIYEFDILRLIS